MLHDSFVKKLEKLSFKVECLKGLKVQYFSISLRLGVEPRSIHRNATEWPVCCITFSRKFSNGPLPISFWNYIFRNFTKNIFSLSFAMMNYFQFGRRGCCGCCSCSHHRCYKIIFVVVSGGRWHWFDSPFYSAHLLLLIQLPTDVVTVTYNVTVVNVDR